eukprot:COSAG05_NODE_1714_length_4230_cov_2.565723_3_plen_53_part_00
MRHNSGDRLLKRHMQWKRWPAWAAMSSRMGAKPQVIYPPITPAIHCAHIQLA